MRGAGIEYLETLRDAAVDGFAHRRVQKIIRPDRGARVLSVDETTAEYSIVADGEPVDLAADLTGSHAPHAWKEPPGRAQRPVMVRLGG